MPKKTNIKQLKIRKIFYGVMNLNLKKLTSILQIKNSHFNPTYIMGKKCKSEIIVWSCFSYFGVGLLHCIVSKIDQLKYCKILEWVILTHSRQSMLNNLFSKIMTWNIQQE